MKKTIAILLATAATANAAGICDICLEGFPMCTETRTVPFAGSPSIVTQVCSVQGICETSKMAADAMLTVQRTAMLFPQISLTCYPSTVVNVEAATVRSAAEVVAEVAAMAALAGASQGGASGDALMNLSGDKGKVLEFTDTDSFLQKYDEMRSTGEQFILFFEGSNAETGEKWCGWCEKFGPAIEQYVIEQTNLTVLKGFVEDPKLWRGVSSHPYKAHPIIKAKGLPTLMLAQGDEILLRVEDDDDFNPQQLTQIAAGDMMANMNGDDDRREKREGNQGMMGDMMEGDHMSMSVGGTKILIKMGATKVAAPVAAVLGAMTLW